MLIEGKVKFHSDEEINKDLYSNGKANNSHHSIFKISTYTYASNAKKLLYLSKLKNE